jgi:hypothetical protein
MRIQDTEFIEWLHGTATSTERKIGASMKRYKVKFSEPDRRNIFIRVLEQTYGVEIAAIFRDGLRFADMGVGRNYTKSGRLTQKEHRAAIGNRQRVPKPITNRNLYAMVHRIEEVAAGALSESAVDAFVSPLNHTT